MKSNLVGITGDDDGAGIYELVPENPKWTRREAIALAKPNCVRCGGYGLRGTYGQKTTPCGCVLRAVFRACYRRFVECASNQRCSRSALDSNGPALCNPASQPKNEDYAADFCLVSKRALSEHHYQIFRFHCLLGADVQECCRRLGIDRETFFRKFYHMQETLGRTFRELEPHGLYPLDEYFHGRSLAA